MRAVPLFALALVAACSTQPAPDSPEGPDPLAIQAPVAEFCGEYAVLRVAADADITVDLSLLPADENASFDRCAFDLWPATVSSDALFDRCDAGRGFADLLGGTIVKFEPDENRQAVVPADLLDGPVALLARDQCSGAALLLPGESSVIAVTWSTE